MAKAKETSVDVLNCTICLETMRKPKSLPCLHTFCASCLVSYITSGLEKHQENINCPLCRENLNRPSETCTPEEWVDDLPSNFLLAGLIESKKVERSEKLCMLCERAGKQSVEEASYFCFQCMQTMCKACERCHSMFDALSCHTVKHIKELSDKDKLFPPHNNTCDIHKNETLKLYCVDHKTPCCCVCVSVYHRKCGEVKSLEDAAKGITVSEEIKGIRKGYEKLEKDFEDDIAENKTSSEKLENDYETALQTIELNYEILRKAVNEKESLRKSELEKVYSEIKDRKEGIIIGLENKQRIIENERKVFEACLQGASETQIVIEMKKFQKLISTHQKENEGFKDEAFQIGFGIQIGDVKTDEIIAIIENSFKIHVVPEDTKLYNIIRYDSFGFDWAVSSKLKDAILFEASKDIWLYGFLSYGCNEDEDEYDVEISVKHDGQTIVEFRSELSKNSEGYKNNITEVKLEKPVKLLSNTKYEVIFLMSSDGECKYGKNGNSEVECEGIIFKFYDSDQSDNGTDTRSGQIPGFIFKNAL